MNNEELLLEGLRVIDCGSWVAAPAAATVLGDFGADVIKVEAPPGGDGFRWAAQYVPGFPQASENYAWQLTARNKRSLLLDLKQPQGYAVLQRLVAQADVFLTNFPPEVLAKLRLRWEDLEGLNPRLVYAQLSGYGEHGPHANVAAFDRSGWWARSGMMDRVRFRGHAPVGGVLGWGDHASAMTLFGGVMAALYRRERTGRGGKVSTSLLANGLWANALPLQARLSGAEVALETPREEMDNALAIPYETADGHWFYPWLFNEEVDWRRFVIALGLQAVADDARFTTREGRARDAQVLIGAIERRVREHDWAHWSRTLAEAGVESISVATLDDVLCDPQVEHNAMLTPLVGTGTVARRTVSSPLTVHGHPKRPAGSAPALGQHSDEVLAGIGYSEEEIAALRAAGVVR